MGHPKHSDKQHDECKVPEKLTDSEKKKKKQENKAKANPEKAAEKKEKNDACRERRKESGSTKTFS